MTRKESLNEPLARPIGFGYGFAPDGEPRIPAQEFASAPILLDDAFLPQMLREDAVAALAQYAKRGIVFDFERPPGARHRSLMEALQAQLAANVPLWAPEGYLKGTKNVRALRSCPFPCNDWEKFCAAGAAMDGWMLELTPWSQTRPSAGEDFPPRFLENALCFTERKGGLLRYFDTRQTLRRKIAEAQRHGCVAALGLDSEYPQT